MNLRQYLQRLLEAQMAKAEAQSPAERARLWRELSKGVPDLPLLSEADVSRESFYDSRD